MTQKIFVMNTRDRYYNGAYKGGILQIDADKKEQYLRVGFVEISDNKIIPKNNIVDSNDDGKMSAEEIKKFLDHAGVKYPPKAKKDELQKILEDYQKSSEKKTEDNSTDDISKLRENLVAEGIIENAEEKTDEEILGIARDNGFIS